MKFFTKLSYFFSVCFLGLGLLRLFVEKEYVGGDAYNLIINANRATAYFTLAILLFLTGFGYLIYDKVANMQLRLNKGVRTYTEEKWSDSL